MSLTWFGERFRERFRALNLREDALIHVADDFNHRGLAVHGCGQLSQHAAKIFYDALQQKENQCYPAGKKKFNVALQCCPSMLPAKTKSSMLPFNVALQILKKKSSMLPFNVALQIFNDAPQPRHTPEIEMQVSRNNE
jgi:hypothetical protein